MMIFPNHKVIYYFIIYSRHSYLGTLNETCFLVWTCCPSCQDSHMRVFSMKLIFYKFFPDSHSLHVFLHDLSPIIAQGCIFAVLTRNCSSFQLWLVGLVPWKRFCNICTQMLWTGENIQISYLKIFGSQVSIQPGPFLKAEKGPARIKLSGPQWKYERPLTSSVTQSKNCLKKRQCNESLIIGGDFKNATPA